MGLIRDGHDHEEVEKARKRVNAACEKNGVKFLGGAHGGEDKVGALKKVIDNGARIISGDDEMLAKEGREYTNNQMKY